MMVVHLSTLMLSLPIWLWLSAEMRTDVLVSIFGITPATKWPAFLDDKQSPWSGIFPNVTPFSESAGNWTAEVEWVARALQQLSKQVNAGTVYQADASSTIIVDEGPVIVTDPPYYDNIGYADLSDFFYVWLRPLLRDIHPELFASIQVPKQEEMIASPFRFENPRDRFEELLNQALRLIRDKSTAEFPSSIFYAYKQQEEEREGRASTGWETMLEALVNAGFQINGTWPMRTEYTGNLKKNVNALATSVVLVCRPRPEDAPSTTRREFLNALEAEMPAALDNLTREGHIAPVDLAQAAIGPGMQVYSRYSRVETISGDQVTVREALAAITQAIANYDERQEGELDPPTRSLRRLAETVRFQRRSTMGMPRPWLKPRTWPSRTSYATPTAW